MHTCIYIRDIYVHKYARKCIHARVCTHIISTHTTKSAVVTYVYTRIHVICVHIHVYMIYEYTHARTRTHAHAHTHTQHTHAHARTRTHVNSTPITKSAMCVKSSTLHTGVKHESSKRDERR